MEEEKHVDRSSSPDTAVERTEHLEAGVKERSHDDPAYVDHREGDDRGEEAKGRNSDKYEKKYWLSVNYIGTLFAIGMAFMGGIGGQSNLESLQSRC